MDRRELGLLPGPPNTRLRQLLFRSSVSQVSQLSWEENAIIALEKAHTKGGPSMRVFIACAIILTAALSLGGCWGTTNRPSCQSR